MAANSRELAIEVDFVTEFILRLLSPNLLSLSLYTISHFKYLKSHPHAVGVVF